MKYLIIPLLTISLFSCTTLQQGDIILKIKTSTNPYKENFVIYITCNGQFYASRGLYNIGDTVKFKK